MYAYKFGFLIAWLLLVQLLASLSIFAKNENCRFIDDSYITKSDSLIQLFNNSVNDKNAAHHAFKVGEYFWFQRQIVEAEKWFLISLEKENQPNNTNDVVNATTLLAHLYHHEGEFEKAENLANQAFEKLSKISNKKLLGNIYEIKGKICHSLGKSEESFKYFIRADSVNMLSPYPEIRQLSVYLKLIIADIFNTQGQKNKSKKYLDEAYKLAKEHKDSTQINLCLQSLARWNISMGKLDKAKEIYLTLLKKQKILSSLLYTYQGMGEVNYIEKNYTQAIINFKKAVNIAKITHELYMLDDFYYDIAKTYFAQNELIKSSIYLDSCMHHKGGNLSNKLLAYDLKSKLLEVQNDYRGALDAIQTKNIIQDSLNRQNIVILTNQLDAANRTKEKDEIIHKLENENSLAEEINRKNNVIKYLFIFIILTLAFVFVLIVNQIKRRKTLEQQMAIQSEQNRISADLHDDIGSTLSSISVYSELANKYFSLAPDKSKDMIGKISILSTELMNRIEDIIWSLKPKSDIRFNFKNKLNDLASDLLVTRQIPFDLEMDDDIEALLNEPKLRKNVLLILKEAMHNISKHSEATQVYISLKHVGKNINITVIDNGKGFDSYQIKGGYGLNNMKKRADDIRATFIIKTNISSGTTINCNIPIASIRQI